MTEKEWKNQQALVWPGGYIPWKRGWDGRMGGGPADILGGVEYQAGWKDAEKWQVVIAEQYGAFVLRLILCQGQPEHVGMHARTAFTIARYALGWAKPWTKEEEI